jgi:hypothetical protein
MKVSLHLTGFPSAAFSVVLATVSTGALAQTIITGSVNGPIGFGTQVVSTANISALLNPSAQFAALQALYPSFDPSYLTFTSLGGSITASAPASFGSAPVSAIYAALWQQSIAAAQGDAGSEGISGSEIASQFFGTRIATEFNAPAATEGVYALLTRSVGGVGGAANSGQNAGAGGPAGEMILDMEGAQVSTTSLAQSGGAGISLLQQGGAGGLANTSSTGGQGGATGPMTIHFGSGSLTTVGTDLPALSAQQVGGAGGLGGVADSRDHSNGGAGGTTDGLVMALGAAGRSTTISTSGTGSAGLFLAAAGGVGGVGATTGGAFQIGVGGGNGGNGGDAGNVLTTPAVLLRTLAGSTINITTTGANSPGIEAVTQGGGGGAGGDVTAGAAGTPGIAGLGGSGGSNEILLDGTVRISTQGSATTASDGTVTSLGSSAIFAQSRGGNGGWSGAEYDNDGNATSFNGGTGGASGVVAIRLGQSVTLSTTGTGANGVSASSVSGAGGDAGSATGGIGVSTSGSGGNSGQVGSPYDNTFLSGAVAVETAATISTAGDQARGILAQAISGPGGDGGDSNAVFHTDPGGPGVGGVVYDVRVLNLGRITTQGTASVGVEAQSIAGVGGVGGAGSGSFFGSSDQFEQAGNAGQVYLTNAGTIATAGTNAYGVVAQSVGGGGGDGGTSNSVFGSSAGSGLNGGAGGLAQLNLGGSITTQGTLAHAVVAQSLGGSGGTGGNSVSDGALVAVAIGGVGGSGGDGGAVSVDGSHLDLHTAGTGAAGLLAQSIGGGGGAGGAAYATSGSALIDAAAAVGGAGGDGGNGGTVTVDLQKTSVETATSVDAATPGVDAMGVVAQSIGGGGGLGGGASAAAFAAGLPTPKPLPKATLTFAYSVGGTGGSGGAGGTATVNLDPGSEIATQGQGSTGILVQSVGGGGGSGGDSSALATSIGYGLKRTEAFSVENLGVNLALAVGGNCSGTDCSGGNGGTATLNLGAPAAGAPGASIATQGAAASGALVQSIGGGGGNAGIGSAQAFSIASSTSISIPITLGSVGGVGGNGGSASAAIGPAGILTTRGAGAAGLIVQSIGGGGGVGSGGSVSLVGVDQLARMSIENPDPPVKDPSDPPSKSPFGSISISPSVTVGATGGAGGAGGAISVTQYGRIATEGKDAPGLLMQSIGGGGGVGGTAGGGSDDTSLTAPATDVSAIEEPTGPVDPGKLSFDFEPSINLGGNGGAAANGGEISATLGGVVTTTGNASDGIVAQSIGGGGGQGGTAVDGGVTNSLRNVIGRMYIAVDASLGASGENGTGGNGGGIALTLDGATVQTGQATGSGRRQSYGILAQSVGGGGGSLIDATDGDGGVSSSATGSLPGGGFYHLGAGAQAGSGSTGNGGAVSLYGASDDAMSQITTYGDGSHGIFLQSLGGGGGIVRSGATASGGFGFFTPAVTAQLGDNYTGPSTPNTSVGGNVVFDGPNVVITTQGVGAFGLLAQSVGGGGGMVDAGAALTTLLSLGGQSGAMGANAQDGGNVEVAYNQGAISTTGVGAHGIVAQSVGGGGGIVMSTYGVGAATPTLTETSPSGTQTTATGNGGAVSVSTNIPILVQGAGAFGILAQSVGGGGGLAALGDTLFAGTTSAASSGTGGPVTVQVTNTITASGENGVGIFAQSVGAGRTNDGVITIDIGTSTQPAAVVGGSGQGAGVLIYDGGTGSQMTVQTGSSLSALSGVAIFNQGESNIAVLNYGTIYGDAVLSGGAVFDNPIVAGQPNPSTLTNAGTWAPGPTGQSAIIGNFVQTAAGRILTQADFAAGSASQYKVFGNASLAGEIVPSLASVVANVALPVLTVTGTSSGTLTAPNSALFGFNVEKTAGTYNLVVASSHFADPRFTLDPATTAAAQGLTGLFNAGNPQQGVFFADLDRLAGTAPRQYAQTIAQLAPRSAASLGALLSVRAADIADATMACPLSADDERGPAPVEGQCYYGRVAGGIATQGGGASGGSLRDSGASWQIGGQHDIAPDLFLGGSVAYAQSWLNSDNGVSGTGDGGEAAITLKYQFNPFLLTGAVFGNVGSTDLQRSLAVPSFTAAASGSPQNQSAGFRTRLAYTAERGWFYLRPSLNLDVVYARLGSYEEQGAGDYGLSFGAAEQTSAIVTPAIETGAKFRLNDDIMLRGFISLGASLRTNSEWSTTAHFLGASASSPDFKTGVPEDTAVAEVSAGLQLYHGNHYDLRLQYAGDYGGNTSATAGSVAFAYHF